MFQTPILFLLFNRPDKTQIVFNEIKKQRPTQLYVFADGPRTNNKSDKINCEKTRNIIYEQVDWSCNLQIYFSDVNFGCGKGPVKGITWFFENVEEGIIIEDDCLLHPDFFSYCEELLEKYRADIRIQVIGATTYRDDYPCKDSYAFTIYATMAAWATWKRVWKDYDFYLSNIDREKLYSHLKHYFHSKFEVQHWISLYDWMVKDGFSDYWDWQFHFQLFLNEGIAIRPKRNLVSNIGIGTDATHTITNSSNIFHANRPTFACMPLVHPHEVTINKKEDAIFYKKQYNQTAFLKGKILIQKTIRKILR